MLDVKYISMQQCAVEAIGQEGVLSLYKGLSHPIIGAVPINMIIFAGTEFWKNYFKENKP